MKNGFKGVQRIHSQIRDLSAYHVQPQNVKLKLDAMECPYAFESEDAPTWHEHLHDVKVNRYPDPGADELKQALRKVFGISDRHDLVLGNGSDEILQMIQLAVGGYGRCIMAPQPSFVMYEMIARYTRGSFVGVDLDDKFNLPAERWFEQLEASQPDCVFFSYPNNPTGNLFDRQLIEQTARLTKGLVVVDEAYHAYSGKTMMDAIDNHENMVVVRTLSKSGLAGLRVGYLVGHREFVRELEKIRMPYNVGVLNQQVALLALNSWDEFNAGERIVSERARMVDMLANEMDLSVYPTATNFITVRFERQSADDVFTSLKNEGILVKNLHGTHEVLVNCLRITVGTQSQNNLVCDALRRIIS